MEICNKVREFIPVLRVHTYIDIHFNFLQSRSVSLFHYHLPHISIALSLSAFTQSRVELTTIDDKNFHHSKPYIMFETLPCELGSAFLQHSVPCFLIFVIFSGVLLRWARGRGRWWAAVSPPKPSGGGKTWWTSGNRRTIRSRAEQENQNCTRYMFNDTVHSKFIQSISEKCSYSLLFSSLKSLCKTGIG